MIDFHSHVLPGIDDGSSSIAMSLKMLEESRKQGVEVMYATPHFYAESNNPQNFLANRDRAYKSLQEAVSKNPDTYPELLLGAEILYFPGISVAEEIAGLTMERTNCLLIEPPLMPWSDFMIDEIEQTGVNFKCIPVIAHVDRYMRMLRDYTLIDRLQDKKVLVQVNASYFLHEQSRNRAFVDLRDDKFHFIGSDCHNMTNRAPNIGAMVQTVCQNGYGRALNDFCYRLDAFIGRV
jgi:protein-tyrosine phosphatase